MTRFVKSSLNTPTVSRHTSSSFDSYIIINGPTAHVSNTAEGWTVCFTQASFSSLSDIHECSGGLKMFHLHLTGRQSYPTGRWFSVTKLFIYEEHYKAQMICRHWHWHACMDINTLLLHGKPTLWNMIAASCI